MTAVLTLLDNLTDATQLVTLHFFFAILLIDRSNDWQSRHKYRYAKFMANRGRGNEACAQFHGDRDL